MTIKIENKALEWLITPGGKMEAEVIDWALGGMTGNGWDEADRFEHETGEPRELAEKVAPIYAGLPCGWREGEPPIRIPRTAAGRWVIQDLVYRVSEQYPDMASGRIDDYETGGMTERAARLRVGRENAAAIKLGCDLLTGCVPGMLRYAGLMGHRYCVLLYAGGGWRLVAEIDDRDRAFRELGREVTPGTRRELWAIDRPGPGPGRRYRYLDGAGSTALAGA